MTVGKSALARTMIAAALCLAAAGADAQGKINGAAGWANATHAAVVKVDLETGEIEVLDYIVTHDCGPIINPPVSVNTDAPVSRSIWRHSS